MFSLQSLITKGANIILTQKLRVPHPSSGSVDSMFKIAAQAVAQCWPVPQSPRREQIAQSAGSATPCQITLYVQGCSAQVSRLLSNSTMCQAGDSLSRHSKIE